MNALHSVGDEHAATTIRPRHFRNLNLWQDGHGDNPRWMLGKWWQIDDEFLNLLPPIYCTGGFRMCERLTDDIAATFLKVGPHFYCAYTDLTITKPEKMMRVIARSQSRS